MKKALLMAALATAAAISPAADAEIIVESAADGYNADAFKQTVGRWAESTAKSKAPGLRATHSFFNEPNTTGPASARFVPNIPLAGHYEVFATYPESGNASAVPYKIVSADGEKIVTIDQNGRDPSVKPPAHQWFSLGVHSFKQGSEGYVEISDPLTGKRPLEKEPNARIYADAIKLVPTDVKLPADYVNKINGAAPTAVTSALPPQGAVAVPSLPGGESAPAGAGLPPLPGPKGSSSAAAALPPLPGGATSLPSLPSSTTSMPPLSGASIASAAPSAAGAAGLPSLPVSSPLDAAAALPALPGGAAASSSAAPSLPSLPGNTPPVSTLPSLPKSPLGANAGTAALPALPPGGMGSAPTLPALGAASGNVPSAPPASSGGLPMLPSGTVATPVAGSNMPGLPGMALPPPPPDTAGAALPPPLTGLGTLPAIPAASAAALPGTPALPSGLAVPPLPGGMSSAALSAPALGTPALSMANGGIDNSNIQWGFDYGAALNQARAANKKVLVFFVAPGNRQAIKYETDYFQNPAVRPVLDQYVLVKINFPQNTRLGYALDIYGAGQIAIAEPSGTRIGSIQAIPATAEDLIKQLQAIK
ncbi:MAG: hypothetical protein ACR2IE_04940 [Candidatus Sumerlaeaceae bacterium]